jgi:hypothetical protein
MPPDSPAPSKLTAMIERDPDLSKCINSNHTISYDAINKHLDHLLSGAKAQEGAEEVSKPQVKSHLTNIINHVKTEFPSTRKHLACIVEEGREPIEDPQSMGSAIEEHYSARWKRREGAPNRRDIDAYLANYDKRIPAHLLPTLPTTSDIADEILATKDSAAGKDGIPFACYRALVGIAAPIIAGVLAAMAQGEVPPRGYNHGRLYVIPKDDSHTLERTRPITVNNASNRILASAVATAISPSLHHLLEHSQKGFIPGRRGDEHVVDLNYDFYQSTRERVNRYVLFLDRY